MGRSPRKARLDPVPPSAFDEYPKTRSGYLSRRRRYGRHLNRVALLAGGDRGIIQL